MTGYFVTGTDTGVGKTTVSRALLAAATARGLRTRCLKPAESGCLRRPDGGLVAQDALGLWEATDRGQALDSVCLYRFEAPVAPGVAAEGEGSAIELGVIRAGLDAIRQSGPDLVLVEGAGGLLVPMGHGRTIADLAVALALPLLIVSRPTLGTINHTLLTIEAARARGLAVHGVIFSAADQQPEPAAVASNAREIERASGIRALGYLPHLPGATLSILAKAAEASVQLGAILPGG